MRSNILSHSATLGLLATVTATSHQHAHSHRKLESRGNYYAPGTYVGCYNTLGASNLWTNQGAASTAQSNGYCNSKCQATSPVFALYDLDACSCGTSLPPASTKVDDTFCNASCPAYATDVCGSTGTNPQYYALYQSTGATSVPVQPDSSSSSSSIASSTGSTPSTSAATSTISSTTMTTGASTTVTTAVIVQTSVKTVPGSSSARSDTSASASATSAPSSGGPSSSSIGIIVGVVVGILALVAFIIAAIWLSRRRRRQINAENSHRRANSLNAFVASGATLPGTLPNIARKMSISDSRLDPRIMVEQRRESSGSVFADNEDYSRRILKVANPDGQ